MHTKQKNKKQKRLLSFEDFAACPSEHPLRFAVCGLRFARRPMVTDTTTTNNKP
jgi:hypothetical protein